jgi:hypothetical protein
MQVMLISTPARNGGSGLNLRPRVRSLVSHAHPADEASDLMHIIFHTRLTRNTMYTYFAAYDQRVALRAIAPG